MGRPLDIEKWSKETQRTCNLCLTKLQSILQRVDTEMIKVESPSELYNLCNSVAAVSKAVHALEMSTRDRKILLLEIKHEFQKDCQKLMKARPDLHEQILDLIDNAEAITLKRLELK